MDCYIQIHILVTAMVTTLSSNLSARLHYHVINKKTKRRERLLQIDQKTMNNSVMISLQYPHPELLWSVILDMANSICSKIKAFRTIM